jgi:acetyl esterase/lipase
MTDTRPLDPALFGDAAIDAETAKLNAQMIELLTGQPEWWVVGAQAMRAARRRGEGPFPAPVMSSRARTLTITGKDGNEIFLRVIAPPQPRGIYLHLHGGGWVLGSADLQDPMLERIAGSASERGTRCWMIHCSMNARWVAAGNEAELAIYPGGAHGFTLFPNDLSKSATARMDAFLNRVLG